MKKLGYAMIVFWASNLLSYGASVFIDNYSFEDDVTGYGTFPVGGGLPSAWDSYDPAGVYALGGNYKGVVHPNEDFFVTKAVGVGEDSEVPMGANVPHGVNAALTWLNGPQSGEAAGIRQVLGTDLTANTRYTMQVSVGNIGSGTGSNMVYYDLEGFPGYSVELWAGGVMIGRDYNTLVVPEREWRTSEVVFDSGMVVAPGQALEIRLVNLDLPNPTGRAIEVDFDNVRLEATSIPEASGLVLLLLAGSTMLFSRGRK